MLRKGYKRIIRTQVHQTGDMQYVGSTTQCQPRLAPRGKWKRYEMLNYFTRFRNRARLAPGPRRTSELNPIMISCDARVSLDQNGAVFLHTRSGVIFTSNRIGASIWQGLLDLESVETIAARISRENAVQPEQVRTETAEFVAELETHGFLSRRIGA